MSNHSSPESDSEEEILVYVELENDNNVETIATFNTLNMTEKHPIIQLDDSFYEGSYENPLGTYMFFEEDTAATSADQLFDKLPENNLKYLCKSRKFLKTNLAYLKPTENIEPKVEAESQKDKKDIEIVSFKNVQQAIDKFKDYWKATNQEKKPGSTC